MRLWSGRSAVLLRMALIVALTASCASLPPVPTQADLEGQIRARGLDPAQLVLPFQANEEMRRWAAAAVPADIEPQKRLRRLLQQLVSTESGGLGLGLLYERGYTATATQVFASRTANCLSFTNLFVALARDLGLPVGFLLVEDIQSFAREGDLIVASDHLTAVYQEGPERLVLDFTPNAAADYRQTTLVDDLTAVALYYSNLGVAALRGGDAQQAANQLRIATQLAPDLATGWANLGVALRRSGDSAGAEAAYRRALEADPETLAAYQNLATLLRLRGETTEADALLALTDRRDNRNPYSFLDLGDLALGHGRVAEAERFYRRAVRVDESCADAQAALGQVAVSAGKRAEAKRWLRKARALDPKSARVQELERRLR
jgi:Flp pilus assembly protein TadD